MALNGMEFLGKDRYFKYRYVQETPINITTVDETWAMESGVVRYKIIQDYMKRTLNTKISYENHKVSFFALNSIYTEPQVFNSTNAILMPLSLSVFEGRQEHFSPSPVFESARTIIVSAAPQRVVSTSLSFLNMDSKVVILMGLTLVLLSLLLVIHSIVTNKYKSVPTKRVVKKMTRETLEKFWENASLLCAEPIPAILPHITCRLLAASWLIGVTFILFFLGCYLRTEFTTESYNSIDTLSDLIKSGIPPTMIQEAGTFDFLKYLGAQDPVVKEWTDSLDEEKIFSSPGEYLGEDGYIPILSGKRALIASDVLLVWFLGEYLRTDPESIESMVEKGGLYISQHEICFEYLHIIFNTSWTRRSPQLHESLQLILGPFFESEALDYLDFKMHHLIERVTWKKPLKSVADLDLSSVFVPFHLFFLMMAGTVAVVITEIFVGQFAWR